MDAAVEFCASFQLSAPPQPRPQPQNYAHKPATFGKGMKLGGRLFPTSQRRKDPHESNPSRRGRLPTERQGPGRHDEEP